MDKPDQSGKPPCSMAKRVVNAGAENCSFLLVQGLGRYDFLKAE